MEKSTASLGPAAVGPLVLVLLFCACGVKRQTATQTVAQNIHYQETVNLPNGSFEENLNKWDGRGPTTTERFPDYAIGGGAGHGTKVVRATVSGPDALLSSDTFTIAANTASARQYYFSALIRTAATTTAAIRAILVSPATGGAPSPLVPASTTAWSRVGVVLTVPAGSQPQQAYVRLEAYGSSGTVDFDDVRVIALPVDTPAVNGDLKLLANSGFESNLQWWNSVVDTTTDTTAGFRITTPGLYGEGKAVSAVDIGPTAEVLLSTDDPLLLATHLTQKRRYYVSAAVKVTGGGQGTIRIYDGLGFTSPAPVVAGPTDWKRTGVIVEPPLGSNPVKQYYLRAEAYGGGGASSTVSFDDIRVTSLPDTVFVLEEHLPHRNLSFERNLLGWDQKGEGDLSVTRAPSDPPQPPDLDAWAARYSITTEDAVDGDKSVKVEVRHDRHERTLSLDTFTLPASATETKYWVTVWMKALGRVRGQFALLDNGVRIVSPELESTTAAGRDWTRLGVVFSVPPSATPRSYSMLLEPENRFTKPGEVTVLFFDNVRIYRIQPYDPCLRMMVTAGLTAPWTLRVQGQLGFDWDPVQSPGIAQGVWSSWLCPPTVPPLFTGRDKVAVGLKFSSASPPSGDIGVRVQFAHGPSEAALLAGKDFTETVLRDVGPSRRGSVVTHIAGFFKPQRGAEPGAFEAGFHRLADDINQRNAQIKAQFPTIDKPGSFAVHTDLAGFGKFHTDPALLAKEIETLEYLGFNGLFSDDGPEREGFGLQNPSRNIAVTDPRSFQRSHKSMSMLDDCPDEMHWSISSAGSGPTARDNTVAQINSRLSTGASSISENISQWTADDSGQLGLIELISMHDELMGRNFYDQATDDRGYTADFNHYKLSRCAECTMLQPPAATCSSFSPCMEWATIRNGLPPNPLDHPQDYENFYWTLRHRSELNALVLKVQTEKVEANSVWPGAKPRTFVNHGPPWLSNFGTYLCGSEYWEFARAGTVRSSFFEDDLNTAGKRWSGIQMNAWIGDLGRSLARVAPTPAHALRGSGFSAYVKREPHEEYIQMKLASLVGKGAKTLYLYRYGPHWAEDNGNFPFANLPDQVRGVALFTRALKRSEAVLYPAQPRPTRVALLWPSTDEIWRRDYGRLANLQLVYLALQHDQIPVDFIDEIEIEKPGPLDSYDFLYVTAQHIRQATMDKIAAWVHAGNYLWVDGMAGTRNEYARPVTTIDQLLGITRNAAPTTEMTLTSEGADYTDQIKTAGSMTFKGSPVDFANLRVDFSITQGSGAISVGNFTGGANAAVKRQHGNGWSFYVGTYAGLTYGLRVNRARRLLEYGYAALGTQRKLVTDFPLTDSSVANYQRPVRTSESVIEADLLEVRDPQLTKAAIVLVNYRREEPFTGPLTVTADLPCSGATVVSTQLGPLTTTCQNGFQFTLSEIKAFDFVTVTY